MPGSGEMDAIRRALEPQEKAAAKGRQAHGGTAPGKRLGKVSPSVGREPRARDKIGAFAGVSGRAVEKIAAALAARGEALASSWARSMRRRQDHAGAPRLPHGRRALMARDAYREPPAR